MTRQRKHRSATVPDAGQGQPVKHESPKPSRGGRGVRLKPGEMNNLEKAYARHLEGQRLMGIVEYYKFHPFRLRLADNTYYCPDFLVMLTSGELQVHETKGFWEDHARVKIKMAASLFPFRFKGITRLRKKDGGGWRVEEF